MRPEVVTWKCDRCGKEKSFPHDEQPLCEYLCVVQANRYAPICGGTINPAPAEPAQGVTK